MPKQRSRRKAKIAKKRRTRNRGNRNVSSTNTSNLVVRGVRSLISCLPVVKTLLPIADVLFAAFGYSASASVDQTTTILYAAVNVYGLTSRTFITPLNLIGNSPVLGKQYWSKEHPVIYSTMREGRVRSISFKMTLDNIVQNRSGRWGAAIVPFRSQDDYKYYLGTEETRYQKSLSEISTIPGAKVSNSDKSITLHYSTKLTDGYLNSYHVLTTPIAVIFTAYSEETRDLYHDFKAADFTPNIQLSGVVELRSPTMGGKPEQFIDEFPNYKDVPRVVVYCPELVIRDMSGNASKKKNKLIAFKSTCSFETEDNHVAFRGKKPDYSIQFDDYHSDEVGLDFHVLGME